MGFWDNLLRREQPTAVFTPTVTYLGAGGEIESLLLGDMTPSQMWSSQPHLRTVVSFLARNIAQLGLHSFERDGDDRVRDRESVFAKTMRRPNEDQTAFDLIFSTVGDLALYDRAYWLTVEDVTAPSGWIFRRIPPPWVAPTPRDAFGFKSYAILSPSGETVEVPADQILAFSGYHPTNPRIGSPTVEALKGTLQEQIEASKYRNQVWKRGGRVSAVLQRPKDAPSWSDNAREQFAEDWYAKFTGSGPKAGGTPILEDGMTLNRIDFNAQENQFVESAKLAFSTVASAFHVNPTMVGVLDNANFSNVREFRRMLYGDTLGPTLAQIEDRINTFLLPRLGMDPAKFYAEFNIAEKLQGSFEEQASVMSTLVGRPIMTADEGRAKFNLSALGGDAAQLVTPLNVLVGGQASPTDSGSQNEAPKGIASKARTPIAAKAATETQQKNVAQVLADFFDRQGKSVLSAIGSGADDWWDEKRWDSELSTDLLKVSQTLADILGKAEADRLGYQDGYNADQTVEFLKLVANDHAATINTTTRKQLDDELAADEGDPAAIFQKAKESRAAGVAVGLSTFVAGFALVEAASQIAYNEGVEPTKTWLTGGNPRSAHASMDGETVSLDDNFSDGSKWPGDGPDAAGCNCSVSISIP